MTDAEKLAKACELLKRWADRDGATVWTFGCDYMYTCFSCHATPHEGHETDCAVTETAKFLEECDV